MENFEYISGENLTVPVSALNALRRDAAELLADKRTQITQKKICGYNYPAAKGSVFSSRPYIAAEISSPEQFSACKDADRILVPIHLWNDITPNEKCFVVLPEVVIDTATIKKQLELIPASYGVYSSDIGMLSYVKNKGHKVYADWGMNIYNSVSALLMSYIAEAVTVSPELSLSAIKDISAATKIPLEVISYGYQRVMTSRACLIRGITGKCDCTYPILLKDKTGAQFTVMGNPLTHLNSIYNSRPTFMADKLKEIKKSGSSGIRLCFTVETASETKKIIAMYKGEIPPEKPVFYTRGYLLK